MRIRGYLELVRPPNIITAVGDPLAGYLLVGGSIGDWHLLAPALATSACLYAAGITLNDVCDTSHDRVNRPERPIPSGRVDRRHAVVIFLCLAVAGLLAARCVGTRVLVTACALLTCVCLYNGILKGSKIAPGVMGLCRALNLAIGMLALDRSSTVLPYVLPAGLMWLYVSSITLFAQAENRTGDRRKLTTALIGMIAAFVGQGSVPLVFPDTHTTQLVLPLMSALLVLLVGVPTIKDPSPARVQGAVTAFVLGILLFDASLVALTRGLTLSVTVLALFVPALLLSRVFRMT